MLKPGSPSYNILLSPFTDHHQHHRLKESSVSIQSIRSLTRQSDASGLPVVQRLWHRIQATVPCDQTRSSGGYHQQTYRVVCCHSNQ